jgi:hypothetical protein
MAKDWYSMTQYQICPYDSNVCGPDRLVQVDADDITVTITSVGHKKSSDFVFGQVCNYEIVWPTEVKNYDKLLMRVTTMADAAEVYAAGSADGLYTGVQAREIKL